MALVVVEEFLVEVEGHLAVVAAVAEAVVVAVLVAVDRSWLVIVLPFPRSSHCDL